MSNITNLLKKILPGLYTLYSIRLPLSVCSYNLISPMEQADVPLFVVTLIPMRFVTDYLIPNLKWNYRH